MKRIIGFLVLASMIVLPSMALAKEQIGIYVAPKFMSGWAMMNGMNTSWGEGMAAPANVINLLHIEDETEMTFGGALAVGYDFKHKFDVPIRTELEYAYMSETSASMSKDINATQHWAAKQNFQAQTLFVNVYYDFHNKSSFTPYVGVGIGLAFINTNANFAMTDSGTPAGSWASSTGSHTETNFAWNVGAGVGYDINERFTIDLGYRFASLGGADTKFSKDSGDDWVRGKTDNLYMHQLALGLRINF